MEEAVDVQLRDLDLDAATLAVSSGKGRKARWVLLTKQALRTLREYLKVRCPAGLLPIGSEAERAPPDAAQRHESRCILGPVLDNPAQ